MEKFLLILLVVLSVAEAGFFHETCTAERRNNCICGESEGVYCAEESECRDGVCYRDSVEIEMTKPSFSLCQKGHSNCLCGEVYCSGDSICIEDICLQDTPAPLPHLPTCHEGESNCMCEGIYCPPENVCYNHVITPVPPCAEGESVCQCGFLGIFCQPPGLCFNGVCFQDPEVSELWAVGRRRVKTEISLLLKLAKTFYDYPDNNDEREKEAESCEEGETFCLCGVDFCFSGEHCSSGVCVADHFISTDNDCKEGEGGCFCSKIYCPHGFSCQSGACYPDVLEVESEQCSAGFLSYCQCGKNKALCYQGDSCIGGVCYDDGVRDDHKVYPDCNDTRSYFCHCGQKGDTNLCMGRERCIESHCLSAETCEEGGSVCQCGRDLELCSDKQTCISGTCLDIKPLSACEEGQGGCYCSNKYCPEGFVCVAGVCDKTFAVHGNGKV